MTKKGAGIVLGDIITVTINVVVVTSCRLKNWQRRRNKSGLFCKEGQENGVAPRGERHPGWKGDSVRNDGLHAYLKKYIPRPLDGMCDVCHIRPLYDLANITGIYNRDFRNWQFQCRRCHMHSDGRLKNLRNIRQDLSTRLIEAWRTKWKWLLGKEFIMMNMGRPRLGTWRRKD